MVPEAHRNPVSFPGWKDVLAASGESAARQNVFAREIIAFLRRCKQLHSPASVEFAKQYLGTTPTQGETGAREALTTEAGVGGRKTEDGRRRKEDGGQGS